MHETKPNPGGRPKPWMRWVLAISLAANMATVGFVVGAHWMSGDKEHHRALRGGQIGGPLTRALSHEDRHEIGRAMRQTFRKNPQARAERRALIGALITDLEAERFDRARVASHLVRQRELINARMAVGEGLLLDHLEQMSMQDRQAYVARLKEKMQKWGARK